MIWALFFTSDALRSPYRRRHRLTDGLEAEAQAFRVLVLVLARLGEDLLGGGRRQMRRHGSIGREREAGRGGRLRGAVPRPLVPPARLQVGADALARPLAELRELPHARIWPAKQSKTQRR